MEGNKCEQNLIHMLLDKVFEAKENGHEVSFELASYSYIKLVVREKGYSTDDDYDYYGDFSLDKIVGSKRFLRAMEYLDSINQVDSHEE